MKQYLFILTTLLILLLAACGGEAGGDTAAATSTAPTADTSAARATPTNAATEVTDADAHDTSTAAEDTALTVTSGRTEDGTYFRGAADAPVTIIDYSDFLCVTCRGYVLNTEPQIIETYINSGQVKMIFWPISDFGIGSQNAHAAADCIGQQNPEAFWQVHDLFFADQSGLRRADRDYFVAAAAQVGVAADAFAACYDSGVGHDNAIALDNARRERGIFNRPTFDINGTLLFGAQPFTAFAETINEALPQ